jgi:hypothetical protein
MARCEDWPCCGHENGCCPDYDEGGNQLNMVCVCGKKLPITSRYSICNSCLSNEDDDMDQRWTDECEDADEAEETGFFPEDEWCDGMWDE